VAAWIPAGGGGVTVVRRRAGGSWTTPRTISAELPGRASFVLAVARSGLASIAWERKVGDTWRIEESHLEEGTWTPPVRVGRGRRPEVVVDGTGTTTSAWSRRGVRVSRRTEGGAWVSPVRVARAPASDLELAANPDGDVVLAWTGGSRRVMVSTRPHDRRGWQGPVTLEQGPYVTSMAVAMGSSGRALVLWTVTDLWNERRHEYQNYLAWARSDSRGHWSSPRRLTRRLGEDGGGVDLSMNGRGLAVAAWTQIHRSDSPALLWAARFHPQRSWAAPVRVSRAPVSWRAPRAWMDHAGVARVVTNRSAIWQFSQRPGARWTARRLNRGRLLDAHGAGTRLVMLYRRQTLWSRTLDVR
jgi:hypothetical protein